MLRTCVQCGTDNRVPAKFLAAKGKCGCCKGVLGPIAEPIDVDLTTFDALVKETRVPIFIDFWAAWCGPCRMVAPEVKAMAQSLAGQAIVLKVDTERDPELAARFSIQSIPTFVILRDGRVVGRRSGYAIAADLATWVQASAGGAAAVGTARA